MYSREELGAAGLLDFRIFAAEVWAYLHLPEPTRTQYDICHSLQNAPRRYIVQGFRGVGKSWLLVAFVLWTLLLDPQKKVMVVSASQQLADDFSKFCKQLIAGMPLLQHLKPIGDQRDSGIAFDVGPSRESKDPSVKSVGITGQLTGSRADLIVADDIETPKTSFTHLLRERQSVLVKEFDAVLKPDGAIIYLGTPQLEETLYNRLEGRGYITRIWPALIPSRPEIYRGRLAPLIQRLIDAGAQPGDPVDPARFGLIDLEERRASYGNTGFQLQFQLDTSPSDADQHPLKCKDLVIADVDPEQGHVHIAWASDRERVIQDLHSGGYDGDCYVSPMARSPEMAKWQGTVMALDPSGRGKDETAYAIVRYLHGKLYLVDVGGFVDGFGEDTLRSIAAAAAKHGVNYVIEERNYGGGMFGQLLRPHLAKLKAGSFDEEWKGGWSSGQKEMRILDTLQPLMESHKLVVDRKVIEKDIVLQADSPTYSFIYQLTRMARQKGALAHEDRLEVVAMACSYWIERMAINEDAALERHKEDALDAELKKYLDHVLGNGGRTGDRFHDNYRQLGRR